MLNKIETIQRTFWSVHNKKFCAIRVRGRTDGQFDGDENVKFLFGVVVKWMFSIVKTH